MPVATITAMDTTCCGVADVEVGGGGRYRANLTCSPRGGAEGADDFVQSARIRETSDLEMPVSTPTASSRSSTARADTPCILQRLVDLWRPTLGQQELHKPPSPANVTNADKSRKVAAPTFISIPNRRREAFTRQGCKMPSLHHRGAADIGTPEGTTVINTSGIYPSAIIRRTVLVPPWVIVVITYILMAH
jgi:hypothetical protein